MNNGTECFTKSFIIIINNVYYVFISIIMVMQLLCLIDYD